jgi:hypothetical protein
MRLEADGTSPITWDQFKGDLSTATGLTAKGSRAGVEHSRILRAEACKLIYETLVGK